LTALATVIGFVRKSQIVAGRQQDADDRDEREQAHADACRLMTLRARQVL